MFSRFSDTRISSSNVLYGSKDSEIGFFKRLAAISGAVRSWIPSLKGWRNILKLNIYVPCNIVEDVA